MIISMTFISDFMDLVKDLVLHLVFVKKSLKCGGKCIKFCCKIKKMITLILQYILNLTAFIGFKFALS
jgi:hypothetical protein